jgi:hypothetical protein
MSPAPVTVVIIGMVVSAAAQAVNLRPGKYELIMEIDLPQMPMKMPPQKYEQCILSNDLTDLSAKLGSLTNNDCKISDLKNTGNTVTLTQTCKTGTFKSKVTYSGDSYVGVSTGQDTQGRPVSMKSTAKRIGDCTK